MTRREDYEIGGVCVVMTSEQAERWNLAGTTKRDLDTIQVMIPLPFNQVRYVTLRRAINSRLEPQVSAMMGGARANRCGSRQH